MLIDTVVSEYYLQDGESKWGAAAMPDRKTRSLLRRSRLLGTLGFVCLACLAPVASAVGAPSPDPPPLAVEPDPQPSQPVVAAPRRPREAPVVVRTPVVQSVAPAAAATTPPAPVVEQPVTKRPARRATKPKPAKQKRPALRKSEPAAKPASIVLPALREPWPPLAGLATRTPAADVLERRRYALAGVVLALVALGGGVLLGVGGRTLKEVTS